MMAGQLDATTYYCQRIRVKSEDANFGAEFGESQLGTFESCMFSASYYGQLPLVENWRYADALASRGEGGGRSRYWKRPSILLRNAMALKGGPTTYYVDSHQRLKCEVTTPSQGRMQNAKCSFPALCHFRRRETSRRKRLLSPAWDSVPAVSVIPVARNSFLGVRCPRDCCLELLDAIFFPRP